MSALVDRLGWGGARVTVLAGDASARRYSRLERNGQSVILMQDPGGDLDRFAQIARHLRGLGLSAPEIHGLDRHSGEMVLEDLGDGLIARLATDGDSERRLYLLAADVLLTLHRHPAPETLPQADPARLAEMTDLAFDWYLPPMPAALRTAAIATLQDLLTRHAMPADVMILRDYHAENILFLPDRKGVAQAGLLDFQDAMRGHRAYDLVSLLRDARRDVGADSVRAAITRYLDHSGQDATQFAAALAVLGVQRNLRILGVFARLARHFGKPHYVDLIPRVWHHLQTDLAHPALAPLADRLTLPRPDDAFLERLKSPCPTP